MESFSTPVKPVNPKPASITPWTPRPERVVDASVWCLVLGFRLYALWLRVWALEFKLNASGIRIWVLGFRLYALGFGV